MSAINLGYFRVLAIPRGMTHAHSQTSFRGNSDQNSFKLAIAFRGCQVPCCIPRAPSSLLCYSHVTLDQPYWAVTPFNAPSPTCPSTPFEDAVNVVEREAGGDSVLTAGEP